MRLAQYQINVNIVPLYTGECANVEAYSRTVKKSYHEAICLSVCLSLSGEKYNIWVALSEISVFNQKIKSNRN